VTPLSTLLLAAATGALGGMPDPAFSPESAVVVVLASEGYPEAPITGREITGLDAPLPSGVTIAHAATARDGDRMLATGGRVLGVVSRGEGFAAARAAAYIALVGIHLEGGHYRHDIAERVS
jgi:phosphoribosylamine---glycine ligase